MVVLSYPIFLLYNYNKTKYYATQFYLASMDMAPEPGQELPESASVAGVEPAAAEPETAAAEPETAAAEPETAAAEPETAEHDTEQEQESPPSAGVNSAEQSSPNITQELDSPLPWDGGPFLPRDVLTQARFV